MSDLISRQDAIDELMKMQEAHGDLLHWTGIKAMLESIPSAEPERNHGEWIDYPECLGYEGAYTDEDHVCSECHAVFNHMDNCMEDWNFCPNCGADMRDDR